MIDWNSVFVALCGFAGTCVGSWGGLKLMSYRIEQLEKKVDKHNNFAERIPVVEEKLKVCEHRIADLEDDKNGS